MINHLSNLNYTVMTTTLVLTYVTYCEKRQIPLRYPARELDSVMEFGLK